MTKKKFYEEIGTRVADAMQEVLADAPELEGIVVGLIYAEEVGTPPDTVLILDDHRDPVTLSRVGQTLSTMLGGIAAQIGRRMVEAQAHNVRLKEENDRGTAPPRAQEAQGANDTRVSHIGRPIEPS